MNCKAVIIFDAVVDRISRIIDIPRDLFMNSTATTLFIVKFSRFLTIFVTGFSKSETT